jgi:UDP-N-acetylmuramoyl-tripeptide--D-alanyl-D-alanine ligase
MFELGEYSDAEHAALGKLASEQDFDIVVLYGENMQHALAHLPKAYYFTDKFSLHNWLIEKAFTNTYFLVKGSRGVGLESVFTVM